jgi:hypothetical protein
VNPAQGFVVLFFKEPVRDNLGTVAAPQDDKFIMYCSLGDSEYPNGVVFTILADPECFIPTILT